MNVPVPRPMFANSLTAVAALVCGLMAFIFPARAQDMGFPLVSAFSSVEIGADAQSWITVQDSDGVLHFGCDALASYDGERWRTTPLHDAYALRGLDFGADGRLWFAATGDIGWFEREEGAPWRIHSLRANLPRELASLGEVWSVFAENQGAVFVSEDKILRWDGRTFQAWPMLGGRRLFATRCAGTIYVQHQPTGLYALGPSGPHLVIPAAVLGDAIVFWMERSANGWLLATSQGLFNFAEGRLEAFAPVASEYVRRNALTSAARLPDGRLVLGTYRGGLVLMRADGTLERILTDEDGLPTRAIFSVFVDRDGDLWTTSPSHIFRVSSGSTSAFFDRRAGLPDLPVLKIVRHEDSILAATDRGVFKLQTDGKIFVPVDELRERLFDLRSVEQGLLAASYRQVKLVSNGKTTTLYATEQDPFVVQPSRQWPGSFLISVGRNIVVVNRAGQARTIIRDLPDMATSMAEDGAGRIWLGTLARGIFSAQPEPDAPVEAVPAAGSRGFPAFSGPGIVVATSNDAVLAFAAGNGWIMGRDTRNFEPIANYPRRGVAVVADAAADGNVWIAHPASDGQPACLARITVAGNHATWQPHSVEGLAGIGVPRAILAEVSAPDSTVLWIGGTDGILRSAATAGPVAPTPRPPILHAFARSAERDVPQLITSALPYSTRTIMFEFAALDFSHRPGLHLETMVEGIDPGWVAAGPDARRELTAVRDGAYTFRVRAVAETGMTSAPAVFSFSILPPWWRTAPALAGALLALAAGIYGSYRVRVGALRRQNVALEKKVRQRTEQLAQASAAKTQFVANMSHDIRNPLNGIVGLALALEDTRLDARQREIVATLRECTTYLSSVVDDVLDFASIEAGRVELRPGPFAPVELLRSVIATLRADTAQSGATLTVEAAPNLPPVLLGDAGRIQQILVNYVSNALKYAGGHIRLAATVPPGAVDEIEFSVADEGAGFSDAEQAVLFTKFTRLPNGCSEHIKGSGLGLASCRLLADIMGGSVGVVSRAGQGARFILRLPLAVCAAPPPVAVGVLPPASVLVVEDTDYNAWAATAVLSKLGLANQRARTGSEALQFFAERRFNVVLLDCNLPDMDGTEVARRMRAMETDGAPAIILAVTAYCTAADRARCLEAGMDAFVGKPLTPEKLRKILIAAGRRLLTAASVQAPPDAPAPALNLSLLGYLSDGTEHGLAIQVGRFLAALAEAEDQLARIAAERDFMALGDAAHHVLSQAKLIGCEALVEAAVALEQAARTQHAATFGELLSRVHREIAALTAALRGRPHAALAG